MCTRPASTSFANSTMCRVPSMFASLLRLGVGGHVVDRREVEEVVDLALQPAEVLIGDAEPGLRQVAVIATTRSESAPQRLRSSSSLPFDPSRTST